MGNGSSIAWNANVDSPSSPGEKCILSDPIEGLSFADVLKVMEIFVRERPLNSAMYEVDRKLTTLPDGGLHEETFIAVTGVAAAVVGDIKMTMNSVYHFNEDEYVLDFFFNDSTLKDKAMHTVIKAVRDPFRLEVQTDEFALRKGGPILCGLVKSKLSDTGYDVEVLPDQDATCGGGLKSVLSGDLKDPELTSKTFWEKISAKMESDEVGTALPDGSIVVESAPIVGSTSYAKWAYAEAEDLVECLDFGPEESMEEVRTTSYWKVVDGPKRLECWAMSTSGRRVGPAAMKLTSEMIAAAFKFSEDKK